MALTNLAGISERLRLATRGQSFLTIHVQNTDLVAGIIHNLFTIICLSLFSETISELNSLFDLVSF